MASGLKATDIPDRLFDLSKRLNELERAVATIGAVCSDLMTNASKMTGTWTFGTSTTAPGSITYFNSTENGECTMTIDTIPELTIQSGDVNAKKIKFVSESGVDFTQEQFNAAYPSLTDIVVTMKDSSDVPVELPLTTVTLSTANITLEFSTSASPTFAEAAQTPTITEANFVIPTSSE